MVNPHIHQGAPIMSTRKPKPSWRELTDEDLALAVGGALEAQVISGFSKGGKYVPPAK